LRSVGVLGRPRELLERGGGPEGRLAEIQRARLLAGALGAIEELGYEQATVAQITTRARVSRRTFYELFENREECLMALFEDVVGLLEAEIAAANLELLPWRERVRGGLWAILCFFDREPALARLCVVEALSGGAKMLEHRSQLLMRLARVLEAENAKGTRSGHCTSLTAEGLVGAACAIVHTRLLRDDGESLSGLLGELMGMIVLPYLGAAAARREQAAPLPTRAPRASGRSASRPREHDPLEGVPMRLTYRTARVLDRIAAQPGVSNRAVAEQADISDQGQISKLLARLERLDLIENTSVGHAKGEANAWRLTPLGQRVTTQLSLGSRIRFETEST
jgi:AcrR family transcriptional regulator/DNA-binding MarR family transcriptional regulator